MVVLIAALPAFEPAPVLVVAAFDPGLDIGPSLFPAIPALVCLVWLMEKKPNLSVWSRSRREEMPRWSSHCEVSPPHLEVAMGPGQKEARWTQEISPLCDDTAALHCPWHAPRLEEARGRHSRLQGQRHLEVVERPGTQGNISCRL